MAEKELRWQVRYFLDELTFEFIKLEYDYNFDSLSEQIAQILEDCEDVEQLKAIADEVYEKTITGESDTISMLADLAVVLRKRSAEFSRTVDGKEMFFDFRRALVTKLQDEFDKLTGEEGLEAFFQKPGQNDDDFEVELDIWKGRILGNIRFIGELYLRKMITGRVVREVLAHLVSNFPLEHFVDLVCELLMIVGFRLRRKFDLTTIYNDLIGACSEAKLSARMEDKIQNVLMACYLCLTYVRTNS